MPPYKKIHLKETISTSSYLRELSKQETLSEGFTVYTDFQTSGRGQKGNSWESEKGKNLLFSTILHPKIIKANQQFILSQIVSLSIYDILSKETSDISIKWPNDIYWKDKKIAGILIENDLIEDSIFHTIVGIGINLNQDTFISDAPNPVSLYQITSKTYNIEDILNNIIERLQYYYVQLDSSQAIEGIKNSYKNALFRKEGRHLFADNQGSFYAEIYDIENSGLLILKTECGEIRKYAFKEIEYILKPS